jgi:hypothetical protein
MQTANAATLDLEHLVMTRTYPGGWVKGSQEATALSELRGDWRKEIEDYGYAVFLVHPDSEVCGVTGARRPGQATP